jgi:hypothetical protein
MTQLELLGHFILFAVCLVPATLLTSGPAAAGKAYFGSWMFALLWFLPLEAVYWYPEWLPRVLDQVYQLKANAGS